ncbi:MAG: hypothetical protein AB1489_36885, partial [Acidobacteriota bacterium]
MSSNNIQQLTEVFVNSSPAHGPSVQMIKNALGAFNSTTNVISVIGGDVSHVPTPNDRYYIGSKERNFPNTTCKQAT